MTEEDRHGPGADGVLAASLARGAAVAAVLAFAGGVVEGLRDGLTFAVLLRWAGVFVVATLLIAVALVGVHALRRARHARERTAGFPGDDAGGSSPGGSNRDA